MTPSSTANCTFRSIEQLDEFNAQLGWPVEYRQIESGSYWSASAMLNGDTWFLLEEQSSRRTEIVAGSPSGMFMLALAEGDPVVINGKALSTDHIFLQAPGSDLRAILPADTKCIQVGIKDEQFEAVIRVVAPELSVPREGTAMFAALPGRLASVRRAMRAALLTPSNREALREEAISRILTDILGQLSDSKATHVHKLHRANARRALDRAKEYIDVNLCGAIRVDSLCRNSGTTLRTLERIFARELGISPQQYLMARRMNSVRRHLLSLERRQGVRITDVAQNHGFTHLGRFATNYRRYFGESPRETLLSR